MLNRPGFAIFPNGPAGVFKIVMRQPGEVRKTSGSTVVWLDQYSGNILAVRDPWRFRAGNTFLDWQFPLHNGEAFGLIGRWIVFIAGFVPLVLYITGLVLWWTRRKARKQREARSNDCSCLSA